VTLRGAGGLKVRPDAPVCCGMDAQALTERDLTLPDGRTLHV